MLSDGTPGGARRGLRGALADLGTALAALVHTRLELVALEFDEVRERSLAKLALVAAASIAFAFALLAASALVVVAFWDTHRIGALVAVLLVYLVIGFAALWRLSAQRKTDPRPFAATLAELERDREWFADKLGGRK